jgi:hypothetical protein
MRRWFFVAASSAAVLTMAGAAQAQDVKIGFILPMTGQQQSTGKQEAAAAKLYMAQHGDSVAGKKIERTANFTTSNLPRSPTSRIRSRQRRRSKHITSPRRGEGDNVCAGALSKHADNPL